MKTKNRLSILITSLLMIFFISNCKKQESPEPINKPSVNNPTVPPNSYNPPAITFSAPVMGFVVDVNRNPVVGATVSTGGKTATTDVNGAFEITSAAFTGDFCYIKATKQGFFTGSTTVHGKAGGAFSIQLMMIPQSNIVSFSAASAKSIALPGGATVDFPANAISKLDGSAYTGNVNVAVTHIDPTATNFSELTPGGDLRAYNTQGQDVMLYSYGMLGVEMRDDVGNYLQLGNGKKATLTMPVPAGMQANAPTAIPLWYFDENKGVWIEEGSAQLTNNTYVGTVAHFTYWNCDVPGPRAKLKGKLRDADGDIVKGVNVKTGQTTACMDDKGNWERWVPIGIDFKVDAYDFIIGAEINLNVAIPKLTDGQVLDLGTLTIPAKSKIKANVEDCNGNPFNGYAILTTSTGTTRQNVIDGKLTMQVYSAGGSADLYFYTPASSSLHKVTITLPVSGQTLNLNTVKVCGAPAFVTEFSFDYDDGATKSVTFTNMSQAEATFRTSSNALELEFFTNSGTDTRRATFRIENPSVGQFNLTEIDSMGNSINENKSRFFTAKNLTFNIVKYEAVGKEVSGTFSGTMTMQDWPVTKVVTISNGKFRALRLPNGL